ncbi:MAG: nucleotide-binding protein [Verrucomicrobiota bacterium]|nr:nucleotide-binding protein [Verrucomicrobiota bacterium]
MIDALRSQALVGGNQTIALRFANKAVTKALRKGHNLIEQGAADNDIYFILSGCCSIAVNEREVAVRRAGEHVGEMALLDTTALRSASVRTTETSVIAKVSEKAFTRIANQYPEVWRRIASILANRLRERSKFHSVPRSQSAIFIGSSSEGLMIAEHINRYLMRLPLVPRLWSQGVFECSKTTIEDLMQINKEVDFAVLVLTGDDVNVSKRKRTVSPRDNVIFELGLFMGALRRERTYIVANKTLDLKIPTDLLGVTYLPYTNKRGCSLARNLQPVLRAIRLLIQKYGPM